MTHAPGIESRPDQYLNFPPTTPYPETYPAGDPAREFLESLRLNLTPQDLDALNRYAGNGDKEVNSSLLGGYESSLAMELDGVIAKNKLDQGLICWRGEGYDAQLEQLEVGDSIKRPQFTSTSINKSVARSARDSLTLLKIMVPQGTKVAVPSMKESEILLPRGLEFRIVGKEIRDSIDEPTVIAVEIVNQEI